LKTALSSYTKGDQKKTGIGQEVAVQKMLEKYEVIQASFHGFYYNPSLAKKQIKCL
jgi:type I restriction enzyme, R subunit